jgi:hypothetical protein
MAALAKTSSHLALQMSPHNHLEENISQTQDQISKVIRKEAFGDFKWATVFRQGILVQEKIH